MKTGSCKRSVKAAKLQRMSMAMVLPSQSTTKYAATISRMVVSGKIHQKRTTQSEKDCLDMVTRVCVCLWFSGR